MTRILFLGGFLVAACSSPSKQPMTLEQMIAADPLPLAKGAKWTYNGTVKRYDPDSEKETSNTPPRTPEVLAAKAGKGVTHPRGQGWPDAPARGREGSGGGGPGPRPAPYPGRRPLLCPRPSLPDQGKPHREMDHR